MNQFERDQKRIDESYFKVFIEELEDGVVFEDVRGFINYANKKVADMLGYSKNELLGKHWSEIVPQDVIEQVALESSQRQYGKKSSYETKILKRSGETVPVIVSSNPVFSNKKKFEGILTVFTDISELKSYQDKLKEERDRSRMLLDIVGVVIFVLDIEGKITLINKKGCQVLACSEEEILGENLLDRVIEPSYRDNVREVFGRIIREEEMESEYYVVPIVTLRGEKRLIIWNYILLKDSLGNINGLLISAADITESKKTQDALNERIKELQCLYSVNKLLSSKAESLEEILKQIVNLIPKGFMHPSKTCASIELEGKVYHSSGFQTTPWKIFTDIYVSNKKMGTITVYYCSHSEESDIGQEIFSSEERHLVEALAKEIAMFIEKKEAHQKIYESEQRYR
ncbi:MAG: PAS domain-containing protein, partial [Candidatus Hodarchaeales archaeon]